MILCPHYLHIQLFKEIATTKAAINERCKPDMQEQPGNQRNEVLRALARVSNIGFRIAACVLTGVLLGRYLDKVFHTTPGLSVIFALTGAGAAFKIIFDSMKPS